MSMSKKMEKFAQIQSYKAYAEKVEIHQQALKGCQINFGSHANYAEMIIKYSLNNYRFRGISLNGHTDTVKKINGKMRTIEIKTGCGELATILTDEFKLMNGKRTTAQFRNGKFDELPKKNNCFEADFVVYIPEPDLSYPLEYQAYVLTGADFEIILKGLGMVRYKQSTDISNRGLDYYDRFAIAEFKNSEKKTNALYDLLEEYGTTFADWLEENEIATIE